MKKNKIMPIVLSFVVGSQPFTALAAELNNIDTQNGKFVLDMNLSMPTKNQNFSIELKNNENTVTDTVTPSSNNIHVEKEVKPGEYTLTIKSENYATYTKQIKIDSSYITTLSLDNNRMNYNSSISENQKGIMAIGDINGDGTVNESDSDTLISAIENGSSEAKYDLNGDSKVDISDLTYIAINKGGNTDTDTVKTIMPEVLTASADENTNVTGNISDITSDTASTVSLAPKNNSAITKENPVQIDIEVKSDNALSDGFVIEPPKDSSNLITGGTIDVEDAEGNHYEATIVQSKGMRLLSNSGATATIEADGTVVVNIGKQVAIKKVTIKVTASSGNNLVDIAKVEFVNGMENRIPEPELNIPEITRIEALGKDSFIVEWTPQTNVSSYNVSVSGNGSSKVFSTDSTSLTVTRLDEKLKTGIPYTVMVQSVNGDWTSKYSEPRTITLDPTEVPAPPESVTVKGDIESISISWKKMDSTDYYNVYYKLEEESEYKVVTNITSTSYKILNLSPNKTYNIYITGVNKIGESNPSEINKATVSSSVATIMPKYKLINTGDEPGVLTDNIKSVKNSTDPLVTVYGGDNAVVDNDPSTYTLVNHYDGGSHYASPKGSTIELTQQYTFDTIRFAPHVSQTWYDGVKFYYKNAEGNMVTKDVKHLTKKLDENGNIYYDVKLTEPVTTDTFQLNVGIWYPDMKVAISEIKVYEYDSLEDDIDALFADNMHIDLAEGVELSDIEALEERLNTPDSRNGEYHPDKVSLQKDIDAAKTLINEGNLSATIINVDTSITSAGDGHLDFAMSLSNLQPLGISAEEGDKIILYVGSPGVADGTVTDLKLYSTQIHGEHNKWLSEVTTLKTGRNEITITSPSTTSNERGGSLYVGYSGKKDAKQYSIRLGSEQNIPVLDVTKAETREEKLKLVQDYVSKLESHVSSLEEKHNENHSEYGYDPKLCTLNFTDIVMDNMMFSFPATQVLAGLNSGDKAEQLLKAIEAMEQEVHLFYQHRGLNENETKTNRYPSQRLNIRYSKMFAGAFMYAATQHIGIEYDSVPDLFRTTPIQSDENGKYISGEYSGWGIAHEIGHVINSSKYVNLEVTNNYFSMLAQSDDTNSTARFGYDAVYKHVTSGTKGKSDDVFTQLAMYWQLHMFYDNYYNYKTFDTFQDQFDNLFYARVSSYTRDPQSAPNSLSLNSDMDNNFMRLACAAAEKNLLPFFEAWGLVPNQDTISYANKFEKEDKKIQYLDDNSRSYRLSGGSGMSEGTKVTSSIDYTDKSKQVTINFNNTNSNDDAMLGYEIIRNGKVVAFVSADQSSYTDTIKTENNRVYEYEVVGYDRLLNTTSVSKAGSVKVSHDGSIGKDGWSADTNMVSDNDQHIEAGHDSGYCEDATISAIKDVIDDNYSNTYTGTTSSTKAEIILDLGNTEQVTALKYSSKTPSTDDYSIYVSTDKKDWKLAKSGTFSGKETETIYFNKENDPCMYIYDASYIKLVVNNSTVSLSELDILGPTGDNVELLQSGMGTLSEDFKYGHGKDEVMTTGSTVITGTYKGNPAYNVVLLKDENGNIINGEFVILAEVPENGNIGEVSSGTWVYKVDDSIDISSIGSVKAELYRVDNAETLEGQRLVSDTLYVNVPESLPPLKIESTVTDEIVPELPQEVPPLVEEEEKEELPPVVNEDTENNEDVENNEDAGITDELPAEEETNENPTEEPAESDTNKDENSDTGSNVDSGVNSDETNSEETPSDVVEVTPMPEVPTTDTEESTNETIESPSIIEDSDLIFEGNSEAVTLSSNIILEKESTQKATVTLKNTDSHSFIAAQTQLKVSDPSKISDVTMNWSEKASKAILKKCIFNKANGTISIYIVSNEPLSFGEDFTFGTLSMKSSSSQTVDLSVNTDKTILVSKTFEQRNGETVDSSISIDTTVDGNSGSSSSGSSGGSSSSKPSQPKPEETNPEDTQPEENTPETGTNSGSADEVFTDINKDSWYYEAVNKAYTNKWFSGMTENEFAPDNNMTRAMLVTVLGRFDSANVVSTATDFTDVPTDMYYAPYVGWAKENNIVNGITENEFAPNSDITREQLAVMVYNYLKYKNVEIPETLNTEFTDSNDISSWATEAVNAMKTLGIINGRPDGSFNPKGTATRAEIATILSNIDNMNIIK